jgi:hypothetical protein
MMRVDPVISLSLRAFLAVVLAVAAVHKLRDLRVFHAAVAGYDLLPPRAVALAAPLLAGAELALAAGLLVRPHAAPPALGAAVLLLVYAGAILVNLRRGRRDIDCGCAGPGRRRPLGAGLVARNGVLAAAALAAALPAAGRAPTWLDVSTIAFAAAALALLYMAVDGLLANAPRIAALARWAEPEDPEAERA